MIERNRELIQSKIDGMQPGQQCGLKEMFGKDWDSIGTPGKRKAFGTDFKESVKNGNISGLRWVRIENNGRFDVYEKL